MLKNVYFCNRCNDKFLSHKEIEYCENCVDTINEFVGVLKCEGCNNFSSSISFEDINYCKLCERHCLCKNYFAKNSWKKDRGC